MNDVAITLSECAKENGFDELELLKLTGVFGMHSFKDLNNLQISCYPPCKIIIQSDEIKNLSVRIDKDQKSIFIILFKTRNPDKRLGFQRLLSQVVNARHLGFKTIQLHAAGHPQIITVCNGFIVWGKYGFLMTKENDRNFFNERMIEEERMDCSNINDFVKEEEGAKRWGQIGKSWYGEFDLETKSPSSKIFIEYFKKWKIRVRS